ncbi:MAG: TonB family protein [Thermoanaerobaculia bacterium]
MPRDEVEAVLARRRRGRGVSGRRALLGSLALHLSLAAAILVIPMLARGDEEPLEFVGEVMIVPAAALGVRNPPPAPARPEPKPAPPEPEPEPPKPEPKPAEPEPKPDTRPAPPEPTREPPKPQPLETRPSTPSASTPSAGDEIRRRQGSPTGSSLGTASFGATGIDPVFAGKYDYYVQQMLAMVSSAWIRPSIGGEVEAVISFRIQKDGSITPARVNQSSGYSSFDLAALRAVQGAAPFPRLPQTYKEDSLGVNLIFH